MPATAIRRRRGRRREEARAKVRGDARSWSRRSAGREPQAWEWRVPAGTRDNKSAAEIGERHLLVGRRRRLVRGRRRASSRMRRPITLTRRVFVVCESVSGLRRDLRFSWSQRPTSLRGEVEPIEGVLARTPGVALTGASGTRVWSAGHRRSHLRVRSGGGIEAERLDVEPVDDRGRQILRRYGVGSPS